jgi:hypothetical protein
MLELAAVLTTIIATLASVGVFLVAWVVSAWLLCAILVALGARARGYSAMLWLFFAILLTPPLAALMLLTFGDRPEWRVRRSASDGRDGLRLCPSCGEVVRAEALRCRFCLVNLKPAADSRASSILHERVEPGMR